MLPSSLITQPRHERVLPRQTLRIMRGPSYMRFVVDVRPFWVVLVFPAMLGNCVHEILVYT